ncbi:ragulator complex protein LAMTOR4-like [Tubulanus polymorphus]|uniref:ragulator complex protein LAMTOR4-like n=1 Tax=Tubulanus polymorphus TaxID=672921 RepID=UPI003DA517B1
MSSVAQGIDKIPDALGYLVLNEDGAVLSSGGELENDEAKADIFLSLIQKAGKIQMPDKRNTFKSLSVIYEDFMYVITAVAGKVCICKRKYIPTEPISA